MTVTDLFKHQHLQPQGPTKWGEPIPCALPGVYVVTSAETEVAELVWARSVLATETALQQLEGRAK